MTRRSSKLERSTRETDVSVELCIDGTGEFDIECDIRFLKHMIETLARYASFDIVMKASGDDEHHIIEDVAITLGTALKNALDGAPIERMSTSILPMDDALIMTSIDLADRPYAEVDCPDPMYIHFLRSFAMSSGMTIHVVRIRGFDEHHIIEATFKTLGKALGCAVSPRRTELSTKDRAKVV